MLEETAALLAGDTRAALLQISEGAPLTKPTDHKGGEATDMFEIALSTDVVRTIVVTVDEAAKHGLRTPRSTKISGFATAWRELFAWIGTGDDKHRPCGQATTRPADG